MDAEFGPLWIRADEQISGRGRRGRDWVSPVGNFYGSVLFPIDLPAAKIGLYSFVAANAVHETLKTLYPSGEFEIKWPNDSLLSKAKISGLLLETGKTHTQNWVIVGIGINLVSHPNNTPYPATSLVAHFGNSPEPQKVLDILIEKFDRWKTIFEEQGFEPVRDYWRTAAANVPGPVTVKLPNEEFDGTAVDIGHNGALQVRLSDGTMRDVHAGDVYLG